MAGPHARNLSRGDGGRARTSRIGFGDDGSVSGSRNRTRLAVFGSEGGLWGRGLVIASSSAHIVARSCRTSSGNWEWELEPRERQKLASEGVGLSGRLIGERQDRGDRGDASKTAERRRTGSGPEAYLVLASALKQILKRARKEPKSWRAGEGGGGAVEAKSLRSKNRRDGGSVGSDKADEATKLADMEMREKK